jgi:hypothetical protein
MEFLSSRFIPEYKFAWIGAAFILLALGSVFFGAVPGRGSCVYRNKDPKTFWFGVCVYFLTGVVFWISFVNLSH